MALPKLQEPFSVLNGLWHMINRSSMSVADNSSKKAAASMKLPHAAICEDDDADVAIDGGENGPILVNGHGSDSENQQKFNSRLDSSFDSNHFTPLTDLQQKKSTVSSSTEKVAAKQLPAKPKNGLIHQASSSTTFEDDETVLHLLKTGKLKPYSLEHFLQPRNQPDRAVFLRRRYYADFLSPTNRHIMDQIPYTNYPYAEVHGVCGENIIGYIPVTRHIAGPLFLQGKLFHIPLATPDASLISSLNVGFHVLKHANDSKGIRSCLKDDGMTRAPAIRFTSLEAAEKCAGWLADPVNYTRLKQEFDSTSQFARQTRIKPCLKDRDLYLRFVATTGDAMGMNMVSKGVEKALEIIKREFGSDIEMIVLSGNYCIDKKVSCLNWIEGRGKSVICDAVLPREIVRKFFNTTPDQIAAVNAMKLRGAELFGSVGGFSSRAADIVGAIFVATGQDVAQVGTSSMCLTTVDVRGGSDGGDLYVSCFMPSLEVGTVGGGTVLRSQAESLDIMGVRGSGQPAGSHAVLLAKLICASVLAGEVAVLAQLAGAMTAKTTAVPVACGVCDDDGKLANGKLKRTGGDCELSRAAAHTDSPSPAACATSPTTTTTTTIPLGLAGPLLLQHDDDGDGGSLPAITSTKACETHASSESTIGTQTTNQALAESSGQTPCFSSSSSSHTIPLATTEGALIASINRGFKAVAECGGISSHVYDDCMSFVVSIRFDRLHAAAKCIAWLRESKTFAEIEALFNTNADDEKSCCVRLRKLTPFSIARDVYLEFQAETGNFMGMQLIAERAREPLALICEKFAGNVKLVVPDLRSSNNDAPIDSCASVMGRNWIHGRGKSVACDAVISGAVVERILKSTVARMVQVNKIKNNGSDLAGSVAGGFNCQAANIVAAIFLATGQNVAHVGTSSLCMTTVEEEADVDCDGKRSLYVSCRMPSLEVGTQGGATQLAAHAGALGIMGATGDARMLARIICATVLAGELSLLAALSQGALVASHEKLNRRHFIASAIADTMMPAKSVDGAGDAAAAAAAASADNDIEAALLRS